MLLKEKLKKNDMENILINDDFGKSIKKLRAILLE